jgi:Gpi18-like mannosyltransferase
VIYKILKSKINTDVALKACCLYIFNPFLLSVGVIWGMFDVLAFLFSLLSAYFLLTRKELSWAFLALACSFKPIPIVLAPLFSIFVFKQTHSLKKAFLYLFKAGGFLAFLTLLPMMVFRWPLSNLYHALTYQIYAGYTFGAASSFSLFNLLKYLNPFIEPPRILYYLWIVACIFVYVYATRRISEVSFTSIIHWSFLTILVFFTTKSWVSEQNLLFLFSFLILSILLQSNNWRIIHLVWILFFVFVLLHVPASSFLWIPYPWTLSQASIFCDGPMGWIRGNVMNGLILAWIGVLWYYAAKRVTWR